MMTGTATSDTATVLDIRHSKVAGKAKEARAQRAAQLEAIEREQVGAARGAAPKLSALNMWVLIALLVLASLQAAATFITSYHGLYGAAEWGVGKQPALQAIAPLMYDVAIVAFTIKLFMDREENLMVRWTWTWIGVLASISAVANVIYTLTVTTAVTPAQLVIGCIISGGSPYLLALTIDVAASKVFRRAERS